MKRPAADALVARLPRITLVVGKGGVGKTTCASALAVQTAEQLGDTLLVSTDPARALPLVLDQEINVTPTPVRGVRRLRAQSFDTAAIRARFLETWGEEIRQILDRGTYLDDEDIAPLLETAMPGGDEIFAALELARMFGDETLGRLIVDTAPTGHTLRLLNLPKTFRALVRLLVAMQAKHRFMVMALTRKYKSDRADAFLREMSALADTLEQTLTDSARCGAIVVTNAETLVLEETQRYLTELRALQVNVLAAVWNGGDASGTLDVSQQFVVPRLGEWPVGVKGLGRWLGALSERKNSAPKTAHAERISAAPPASAHEIPSSLFRPLTIVAGKGGVGKTTVAAALALQAARTKRVLVVSTDPAPSLADAYDVPIPDADTAVPGVPNLFARQMDASAAFARMREEYQNRVDALFDGLVAGGVDLAHDRAVARDLLSLAPPGVDEVYALSLIADALFKDRYECVIVDPAPTGHLLRLLEMPQLALEWSHQLLRLMLKYKEVAGLGESARDLLEFSKSLRTLDALLRDAARSGVVIVTLDEPVVRAETERLAREIAARHVDVSAIVLNKSATPLPASPVAVQFQAPATTPPPRGVAALRAWSSSWSSGRS